MTNITSPSYHPTLLPSKQLIIHSDTTQEQVQFRVKAETLQ